MCTQRFQQLKVTPQTAGGCVGAVSVFLDGTDGTVCCRLLARGAVPQCGLNEEEALRRPRSNFGSEQTSHRPPDAWEVSEDAARLGFLSAIGVQGSPGLRRECRRQTQGHDFLRKPPRAIGP